MLDYSKPLVQKLIGCIVRFLKADIFDYFILVDNDLRAGQFLPWYNELVEYIGDRFAVFRSSKAALNAGKHSARFRDTSGDKQEGDSSDEEWDDDEDEGESVSTDELIPVEPIPTFEPGKCRGIWNKNSRFQTIL